MKGKFAVAVMQTKRPVSGRQIGWRIKIAVFNRARYDVRARDYVQSFAPKYLLAESGDYLEYPAPEVVARFVESAWL